MSSVVNCGLYEDGRRIATPQLCDVSEIERRDGTFTWIGVHAPDPELLHQLQEEFHLHDLAIEDAVKAHQRPKLEEYGDSLFVVLRPATWNTTTKTIELAETHLFVGRHFIVCLRHGDGPGYAGVRARCETSPQALRAGPAYPLYAIMDFVVDNYFPVVDELEDEIEAIEEALLAGDLDAAVSARVYRLRNELVRLKRAVSPLVEVTGRLARFDGLVPSTVQPYFRDVYDHALRINEQIEGLRDLLTGALESALALISVRQNDVTKKLAAWAAIVAVLTMVAGLFGMNFQHLPGTEHPHAFWILCSATLAVCGALWGFFRRNDWL